MCSNARAIDVLRDIFAAICADAQATLVQMDVEDDHVHLPVQYFPSPRMLVKGVELVRDLSLQGTARVCTRSCTNVTG